MPLSWRYKVSRDKWTQFDIFKALIEASIQDLFQSERYMDYLRTMKMINLRDYYPVYTEDTFVEVSDEVAAFFAEDKRRQTNHAQAEKVKGVWEQRLTIHYNCIGAIDIPDVLPLPYPEVSVNTRKGVVVTYVPNTLTA